MQAYCFSTSAKYKEFSKTNDSFADHTVRSGEFLLWFHRFTVTARGFIERGFTLHFATSYSLSHIKLTQYPTFVRSGKVNSMSLYRSAILNLFWSRDTSEFIRMVTHPDTNHEQCCSASVIHRGLVHSTCYRRWWNFREWKTEEPLNKNG
jgi:hypothetical protein